LHAGLTLSHPAHVLLRVELKCCGFFAANCGIKLYLHYLWAEARKLFPARKSVSFEFQAAFTGLFGYRI
jgi:hypothetical protein